MPPRAITGAALFAALMAVSYGIAWPQTPCLPGNEALCHFDQWWQQQEQQWELHDLQMGQLRQQLMQDALRHQRRYERQQHDNWNRAYRNYRMHRGDNPWEVWNDYYQNQQPFAVPTIPVIPDWHER